MQLILQTYNLTQNILNYRHELVSRKCGYNTNGLILLSYLRIFKNLQCACV